MFSFLRTQARQPQQPGPTAATALRDPEATRNSLIMALLSPNAYSSPENIANTGLAAYQWQKMYGGGGA
jgi:hypothetical protein